MPEDTIRFLCGKRVTWCKVQIQHLPIFGNNHISDSFHHLAVMMLMFLMLHGAYFPPLKIEWIWLLGNLTHMYCMVYKWMVSSLFMTVTMLMVSLHHWCSSSQARISSHNKDCSSHIRHPNCFPFYLSHISNMFMGIMNGVPMPFKVDHILTISEQNLSLSTIYISWSPYLVPKVILWKVSLRCHTIGPDVCHNQSQRHVTYFDRSLTDFGRVSGCDEHLVQNSRVSVHLIFLITTFFLNQRVVCYHHDPKFWH